MYRHVSVILLFLALLAIVGCATIFTKQEWSENYTQLEGVQATSPEMIDGNIRTAGETTFPESVDAFSTPPSEVVITLPEKKSIRRIVIHSDNLKVFDIFGDKGGVVGGIDWRLIKEVKSANKNPINVSVPLAFPTDRIRVRVLKTKDDAGKRRQDRARYRGRYTVGNLRAAGKIYEIELYGYKSTAEAQAQAATQEQEDELDQLLK